MSETYQVHRGGPRCWYIQEIVTGGLEALPFTTRHAAQEAVDARNQPAAAKRSRPTGPSHYDRSMSEMEAGF